MILINLTNLHHHCFVSIVPVQNEENHFATRVR